MFTFQAAYNKEKHKICSFIREQTVGLLSLKCLGTRFTFTLIKS